MNDKVQPSSHPPVLYDFDMEKLEPLINVASIYEDATKSDALRDRTFLRATVQVDEIIKQGKAEVTSYYQLIKEAVSRIESIDDEDNIEIHQVVAENEIMFETIRENRRQCILLQHPLCNGSLVASDEPSRIEENSREEGGISQPSSHEVEASSSSNVGETGVRDSKVSREGTPDVLAVSSIQDEVNGSVTSNDDDEDTVDVEPRVDTVNEPPISSSKQKIDPFDEFIDNLEQLAFSYFSHYD